MQASFTGVTKGLKRSLLAAVCLTGCVVSAPAAATDFSFTGTLDNANDFAQFNFFVPVESTVTLLTYSYAGGTNAAGTIIPQGGFDPILALFDSTGLLINQNDDGGSNVPLDPVTNRRYDTYLQSLLAPGNYSVTVMAYSNFAVGPNLSDGFEGGGNFTDVTGDQRTNAWAFDILNVGEAVQVGGVPEPSTWAMMLLGFGFVGGAMRHRKRKQPKAHFAF